MKFVYYLLFLISFSTLAQDYKFGQVSAAILEETQDSILRDIPAKVVYRRILFDYKIDINNALVNASYYEGYKQMFAEIFKISQSKIILSKI